MDSFEITLDHPQRIVRVTAAGELYQEDGEKIITAARKTAVENGYDILYDIREATTKVIFASWYHLPRKLEVFKDISAWRTKAAILASREDKALSDYKFYEVVTDNLGLKLRLFFDEAEAVEWLKKDRMKISDLS